MECSLKTRQDEGIFGVSMLTHLFGFSTNVLHLSASKQKLARFLFTLKLALRLVFFVVFFPL